MKNVFSKTDDIATIWAAQSQASARTGSNTWMDGTRLGSYGTVVARLVETREGRVALVSHHRYSNTTAVVIGQARHRAFVGGALVFEVAILGGRYEGGDLAAADHETNLALYARRIDEALDKIKGAKKFNGARYRRDALALIGEAAMYARAFRLRWTWKGRSPLALRSRTEETSGY